MNINNLEFYLDGGTCLISTDNGNFAIDERIHTSTEGEIYQGYPEDDNSNLLANQDFIKSELLEALGRFSGSDAITAITAINMLNGV